MTSLMSHGTTTLLAPDRAIQMTATARRILYGLMNINNLL
ncbi:unknown [Megasphaera elsdenii CAG:570]|uniref:Uncharacterized protein n=1 Tax=Megasphaera elsdenii CAG:570 TaxID=1263087 RepID=R7MW39_MEGEL|nr:unknown [Megasphaera elsdenii CAG:570]